MDLVIAHYNCNIDWIQNINTSYTIYLYSKTIPSQEFILNNKIAYIVHQELNKGNEASAYLQYIIDKYDSLPEYVLFVHDHETSWHHEGSIINIINSYKGANYINLNKYGTESLYEKFLSDGVLWKVDDYMDSAQSAFENPPHIMKLDYNSCAQFAVSRKVIRSRSKEFYKRALQYIIDTSKSTEHNSRVLEYYWRWIFIHDAALSDKYK